MFMLSASTSISYLDLTPLEIIAYKNSVLYAKAVEDIHKYLLLKYPSQL